MEGFGGLTGFLLDVKRRSIPMRAVANGVVIAHSDDTVVVEGNHYFPLDSVTPGVLADSDHRSVCIWKGLASYYDVTAGGVTLRDAAWYYPKPSMPAGKIKGRVAFWKGVVVEPTPSAVHGG